MTTTGQGHAGSHVELKVPAETAYVAVLRTTTAGLAARLDFTIDDIEDLRIAVGEACAMVLPEARPGADLWCRFGLGQGEMLVSVVVEVDGTPTIDHDSFAWQVLTTLATDATTESAEGRLTVSLMMRSEVYSGAHG